MRQPSFYSAVFAIIRDESWAILFQKRQNSGFRDGHYQLPSWHVESKEDIKTALIRELSEELGISVHPEDIDIVHIAHVIRNDRTYFNIYLEVHAYTGEIRNQEPNKCSEIVFKKFEDIRDKIDFQYDVETLEKIFSWEKFSEKILPY